MQELEKIIKGEIRAGGPMTFARFMELALYHPVYGYYSSGRVRIGKEGDFYTSSHASKVFGKLVAEAFLKMSERIGEGAVFIEAGAGEGWFAKDFIEGFESLHPNEFKKLQYIILERSEGLRARQKENLGDYREKVRWLGSMDELSHGVKGVIFSNELMDAFPFNRVRQEKGTLSEVFVELRGDRLQETTGPVSTPEIDRYFESIGVRLEDGMTTEVNLLAPEWMSKAAGALEKGIIITIDYGYSAGEYYSPERRRGTMMCYRRHKAGEDPYADVGEQDITAHADFSSLAQAGRINGAEAELFTDQTSFLIGPAGWLDASMKAAGAGQEEMEEMAQGLKSIIHPDWMGGAFKVLVQSKETECAGLFGGVRNRAHLL